MDWTMVIVKPIQDMLSQIGQKIPALGCALLVLIVGWLIAKAIRVVVTRTLKIVRFDVAAGKAGISNTLIKGGIKHTPAELIGILAYWLAMMIVFAAAVNTLGLEIAAEIFNQILLYIPNVIAAVFVLVLGMFLASFVGGIVRTATSNAGVAQAKILGDITQYIIVIFTAVVALGQLKVEIELLRQVIVFLVGGVCLAFGLAFGLGCKDIAGDFMKRLLTKYTKE